MSEQLEPKHQNAGLASQRSGADLRLRQTTSPCQTTDEELKSCSVIRCLPQAYGCATQSRKPGYKGVLLWYQTVCAQ
jgi:hypothetical protein